MAFSQDRSLERPAVSPPSTSGTTAAPAPVQPPAKKETQPKAKPEGKIQDNPQFRGLPRDVQRKVESGALTLDQAVNRAGKQKPGGGGGRPPQPTPTAPTTQAAKSPNTQGPKKPQGQRNQPNLPQEVSQAQGAGERLGEGVSAQGATETATFARPGEQRFQGFAGQARGQNLRDVAGQNQLLGQDVQQALGRGDLSRALLATGGGGAGGGGAAGLIAPSGGEGLSDPLADGGVLTASDVLGVPAQQVNSPLLQQLGLLEDNLV